MESILYERPREKLQFKGAKSLTRVELFQILIGSGTPHYHVAKIAREIVKVLDTHNGLLTYEDLSIVKGLGHAKVCQILAVLELNRRYATLKMYPIKEEKQFLNIDVLKNAQQQLFIYETYNGDRQLIERRQVKQISRQYHTAIRKISAEVVADNAARVSFALGSSTQGLILTENEFIFIKTLSDSLNILEVSIASILLVNKTRTVNIKDEIV